MKKLTLLACLTLSLIFSGCESDDAKKLISKTITSADGLTIELTWTINGEAVGFEYADIDFVLDDLEQGEGVDAYENSSGNSFGFEDLFMADDYEDGTYLLAPFIYNFEVEDEEFTTSDDIQLTFKIYPGADDSEALLFEQKFSAEKNFHLTEALAYAKFSIVKEGDKYKIKELSKVKEINSGWFDGI